MPPSHHHRWTSCQILALTKDMKQYGNISSRLVVRFRCQIRCAALRQMPSWLKSRRVCWARKGLGRRQEDGCRLNYYMQRNRCKGGKELRCWLDNAQSAVEC